jgi:hypothetical protein
VVQESVMVMENAVMTVQKDARGRLWETSLVHTSRNVLVQLEMLRKSHLLAPQELGCRCELVDQEQAAVERDLPSL